MKVDIKPRFCFCRMIFTIVDICGCLGNKLHCKQQVLLVHKSCMCFVYSIIAYPDRIFPIIEMMTIPMLQFKI